MLGSYTAIRRSSVERDATGGLVEAGTRAGLAAETRSPAAKRRRRPHSLREQLPRLSRRSARHCGGTRRARPLGIRNGLGAVHLRNAGTAQGTGSEDLPSFLGTEDAILYSSCFDANGGLFETLLGAEDAVISDELNHASIIDGVRLSKAQRFRYRNRDMADLETQFKAARGARFRMIATDGVFSMDGTIAPLAEICELAEKHDAMVMVDDSHAVGFMGPNGRGTHEHAGVMGRVDILTGTLGKALGGASGGYTAGPKAVIDLLRQRSRPYLFSNSLPPAVVAASIESLKILAKLPRTSRTASGKHGILPAAHDGSWPRHSARRASDRAGDDR